MSKVIVTIIPRGKGEFISTVAKEGGASGGTILLGKGSAPSSILQFLGLGETAKDVTISIVEEAKVSAVLSMIRKETEKERNFGVLFTIAVDDFIRSGNLEETKEKKEMETSGRRLISVIINRGYADDAMAAARSAGASGGTILQARGTARADEAAFFGVQLVPEKEMLLIVVEAEKYEAVFSAIQALPCWEEKGCGIEFSLPVCDFSVLGARR